MLILKTLVLFLALHLSSAKRHGKSHKHAHHLSGVRKDNHVDEVSHQQRVERIMEFMIAPYLILLKQKFNDPTIEKIPLTEAVSNQPEKIKNATLSIYDGIDTNEVLVSQNEVEFMLHYAVAKGLEDLDLWKGQNGGGFQIAELNGNSTVCNVSDDDDDDDDHDDHDDDDDDDDKEKKERKSNEKLMKSFSSSIIKSNVMFYNGRWHRIKKLNETAEAGSEEKKHISLRNLLDMARAKVRAS